MYKANNIGMDGWGVEPEMLFNKTVSISYDNLSYDPSCEIKVLVLLEPQDILAHGYNEVYNIHKGNPYLLEYVKSNFDLVLCWNEKLLNEFPSSKKLVYGECFLDLSNLKINKKNKISYLTSNKAMTVGHEMRHQIYQMLSEINNINGFEYIQHMSPPRLETKNEILNDSKFSIILENSQHNNYFTEKIVDCFVSKTIPIYWGCPNLNEYFNMEGVILFESLNELVTILSNIEDGFYEKKIDAIEDNFFRAKQFFPVLNKVEEKINEFLGGM